MDFQLVSNHEPQGDLGSAAVPAAYSASEDAGTTLAEIRICNRGHLPHWERESGTYFVTFRLADSLSQSALNSFETERRSILRTTQRQGRDLTASEQKRLAHLFSERIEKQLDSGSGACHLAKPKIAQLVADTLRHFDGKHYRLWAWCVMPTHVHVVVELWPGQSLAKVLHSWKSYSAKTANKILCREGTFWQREYYDHLIRDERQLFGYIQYVQDNPMKACLKDWPWVWIRKAAESATL